MRIGVLVNDDANTLARVVHAKDEMIELSSLLVSAATSAANTDKVLERAGATLAPALVGRLPDAIAAGDAVVGTDLNQSVAKHSFQ